MILLDKRAGNTTNRNHCDELLALIRRVGVPAEFHHLEFGDVAFEGKGPDGPIMVGIERKTISDMLNCIDDSRYSAHQLPGMVSMYNRSMLILEGGWKPDLSTGYLMELVASLTWRPLRYRSAMVRYSKLFRYLMSIQLSGVNVIYSKDIEQTAFDICECYYYFQKKWEDHTSLLEVQKLNIPTLTGKPSLVRRWASDLEGVGVKHSIAAEQVFKTPLELAKSDEGQWMKIPGMGAKLAMKIIRQIQGTK